MMEGKLRVIGQVILALIMALTLTLAAAVPVGADANFEDLTTLTPEDLVAALVGPGVTIVPGSVSYTGAPGAAGFFAFTGQDDCIGISSGIILSSGNITNVEGPNIASATTTAFGTPGDPDLSALAGQSTYDAAILQFEFEVGPETDRVFFRYVFGSDEYNEFVYSINDVFAFWVNGVNYAVVNGDPVSINTINHGSYADMVSPSHPELYINNDPFNGLVDPGDVLYTEMDGFTVVLTLEAPVNTGTNTTNTMKLAIADASDSVLDSWVFIEEGSLTIEPAAPPPVCDFTAEPRTGRAPLTVHFTDLSIGQISSWLWNFGDGTTSNQQHPTHTYTQPGQYTVRLAVTDEFGGSDELTRVAYITVEAEPDEEREREDAPDPARLAAFNMLVSPGQVLPNQHVEISINIGNSGGLAGTREVNLYINSHFEDNQTVTVPAGSTSVVLFTVTKSQPGTYHVSVDGHEGQFTVVGGQPGHWGGPLGTGGIIAIIVVVIALALGLVFVFRRR